MTGFREPRTYLTYTYGCQMNERDSETIAGILADRGLEPVTTEAQADMILINTCTVRDKAEQKVFGLLGKLRELKEQRPHVILGITGCMPQQQEVAKKIKVRFPFMDLIIGTHNLSQLGLYLDEIINERRQVMEIWEQRSSEENEVPARRSGSYKAFVNINYGCNNFCTYCIVPYVRGREKSRRPESILAEIKALVSEGYREITLLGQNVNSYGKDLPEGTDFASLLAMVNDVEGVWRIRFMTSHPRDVSERLIQSLANLLKVCCHLHLPLQAGSNRILAAMNRGYTREHYLNLVAKLKGAVPALAITTDLIVGFPGETEADFQETLAVVREVGFDSAFTFMYSPRTGTPAASMEEQVETGVKRSRLQELLKLQNALSLERNQALVGTVQELLVEDREGARHKGRTSGHKLVYFDSAEDLTGKLVPVRITLAKTWNLLGEVEGD